MYVRWFVFPLPSQADRPQLQILTGNQAGLKRVWLSRARRQIIIELRVLTGSPESSALVPP